MPIVSCAPCVLFRTNVATFSKMLWLNGGTRFPPALFIRYRTATGRVPVGVLFVFVSLFVVIGLVRFMFVVPPIMLPGGALFSLLPLAVFPLRLRVSPSVIRKIESRIPVGWGGLVSCSVALLDPFSRIESY